MSLTRAEKGIIDLILLETLGDASLVLGVPLLLGSGWCYPRSDGIRI